MRNPLMLLDGIFGQDEEGTYVHMDGVRQSVDAVLSGLVQREITVQLHHLPPQPVDKTLPGGGSCLWGGHCPHGHQSRPGWLHNQSMSGVLSNEQEGEWRVGGSLLRLGLMPGHYGRLIVMDDEALKGPPPDASVDELLKEAGQMANLLEALKGAIRE